MQVYPVPVLLIAHVKHHTVSRTFISH